jgi:lauroyl/myristoyl acyltransferase
VSELDRRSYDGAGRALARIAASHPKVAYALAGALGAFRNRLTRRWPTADEMQSLFGDREVAPRIAALNEKNRLLVRAIQRHGLDAVRPLVTLDTTFDGPRILAMFHVGALHAIGAALERLGRPVLAARAKGLLFTPRPPLEIAVVDDTPESRAALLHRALQHLRGGGSVALAIDEVPGDAIETRCLGRTLRLAPGAFALARWSGVPIVPITARWTGSTIRVDAGHELASPGDAAAWLEDYLRESPSELTLGLLRKLS